MSTNNIKNEKQSGLSCPTIGRVIPKGYELVQNNDGRWVLRKKG